MDESPEVPLTTAEELAVVSAINASFQVATQQADSKISMLLVLQPGTAVVVAGHLDTAVALVTAGRAAGLLAVPLLLGFLVSFLESGYHLLQALRPRVRPPSMDNLFAFPALAASAPDTVWRSVRELPGRELCADAWALAWRLATIAMVKNRHVSRAITWIAVMVATALPLTALFTLAR